MCNCYYSIYTQRYFIWGCITLLINIQIKLRVIQTLLFVFMSIRWESLFERGLKQAYCSPPDDVWVSSSTVEWYRQGTKEFGEKSVPVPLCAAQIHELTRAQTPASAVRGRRLTAWAMAGLFIYYWTTCFNITGHVDLLNDTCQDVLFKKQNVNYSCL
jgi:hypothetical protein